MTGIDTNVLLRFLLGDDPVQTPLARAMLQSLTAENPGWVGVASVLETVWVLSSAKKMDRRAVARAIGGLLDLDVLVVERAETVASAIRLFGSGQADFADCLIACSAKAAGCSRTLTFDRRAARDAGMELIE